MEATCECCGAAYRGVREDQLTLASIERPLDGLVLRVEYCARCNVSSVVLARRLVRSIVDDRALSAALAPGSLAFAA